MSAAFIVFAFVAAVNAARRRFALPEAEGQQRPESGPVLAGAVLAFAAAAAGVALAEPFLDAIDVAPESFEIAAGLVVILAGGWALIFPRPREDQGGLAGWGAALVPISFPLLLSAEFVALVLAFGAIEQAGTTLAGAGVGIASLVALGLVGRGASAVDTALAGLARLSGLALVVVGVQLIVEGVRDV